ncbi:MAG: acylphosphatase [Cryomorphaceae bacterium]
MKKHFNIRVSGLVQGVWFRKSAKAEAIALGLNGFVRNEKDGSVYLEAEGETAQLDSLVAWCQIGPAKASVEHVAVEEGKVLEFQSFQIR